MNCLPPEKGAIFKQKVDTMGPKMSYMSQDFGILLFSHISKLSKEKWPKVFSQAKTEWPHSLFYYFPSYKVLHSNPTAYQVEFFPS